MRKYTLFKRKAEDRDPIWRVKVDDDQGRRKASSMGSTHREDAIDFAELRESSWLFLQNSLKWQTGDRQEGVCSSDFIDGVG